MTANRFIGFTLEKFPRNGVTCVPISVLTTPPIVQVSSLIVFSVAPSIQRYLTAP